MKLWVVVPAYNEAAGITATLAALARQARRPDGVLVVDNASTDGTAEVVREFAARHPDLGLEVVAEPEKGTGSAADTGFREAIARGATHLARTDADCVPPPLWTAAMARAFGDGLEMVAGRVKARTDEFPLNWRERHLLPFFQELAAVFGRYRPGNRGPGFTGPYIMAPACTLGITAELYERSGGFPRAPIEEIHDDRELVNRVRRVTSAYGRRRDVWVYWSMRRTRAYGLRGTLSWYANHGNNPKVVDIRMPEIRQAPRPTMMPRLRLDPAMAHERRLHMAAHPFVYPLVRALARRGPVVKLPGLGVVVNDAAVARQVLLDGERFRKDGPGASGELWTPLLGPSLLLNMEGEAHRSLRRRLGELFTPGYTEKLCERVLAEPLARLDERLAAGRRVDVADAMRVMAGAVICELIGIEVDGDAARREETYRRYFAQGSELIAMVKLTTRKLSPRQIAIGRAVLDPIADVAAKAWAAGDESTVVGRMRALGLSEAEARGAVGAFFLTGTETVVTAVPRLVALLHDSGRLADVAADPDLLDRAIEEALRVTTPTPIMLRSVAARADVGGVPVKPGDRVVIATHNCARAYGDFDIDRPHPPEVRRLWFGAGPHFCIGYPLAIAETRAVARTLLRHAPLRVVERRAARKVLLPAYDKLEVVAR